MSNDEITPCNLPAAAGAEAPREEECKCGHTRYEHDAHNDCRKCLCGAYEPDDRATPREGGGASEAERIKQLEHKAATAMIRERLALMQVERFRADLAAARAELETVRRSLRYASGVDTRAAAAGEGEPK